MAYLVIAVLWIISFYTRPYNNKLCLFMIILDGNLNFVNILNIGMSNGCLQKSIMTKWKCSLNNTCYKNETFIIIRLKFCLQFTIILDANLNFINILNIDTSNGCLQKLLTKWKCSSNNTCYKNEIFIVTRFQFCLQFQHHGCWPWECENAVH